MTQRRGSQDRACALHVWGWGRGQGGSCRWDTLGAKRGWVGWGGHSRGRPRPRSPDLDVKVLRAPGRTPYVNIIFNCNSVIPAHTLMKKPSNNTEVYE